MAKRVAKSKLSQPKSIRFKYIYEECYNPKYCNGAYGGLSPRGEIVMNFYLERTPLPKEQTHKVDSGKLGDLISTDPDDLQSTIVESLKME